MPPQKRASSNSKLGGEAGNLINSIDWSKTALGPRSEWPQNLNNALGICLNSAFPIAIYWGDDLTLLYNDPWSPIPGTKHPWALGKAAIRVWPEIWNDIDPLFKRVFETGEASRSIDGLLPMQRHGYTEECYFDFTFTPISDEQGNVEGIFNAVIETTYRVISERRSTVLKYLTEQLNRSKSLEEIMGSMKKGLTGAEKDIPYSLFYLNNSNQSEFGMVASTGFPIKSSPDVLLSEGSLGEAFQSILKDHSAIHITDNRELFGDTLIPTVWPEPCIESYILPVGLNKPVGFLVVGINPRRVLDNDYKSFLESIASQISTTIHNVRSLEEEKDRAIALAEIDKAKTVFFSNVSHEFRTPLTLMLGPLSELLGEVKDKESQSKLELIQRNGVRLQKLVNALLDFSRIEAGRFEANYQPTDLVTYTQDLASNFRSAIEKAGMKLVIESVTLSGDVYIDREMWEKIILNLLSNAFKFTFEGAITITIIEEAGHVMVAVQDTGVGIPADHLENVFERFQRVEGAKSRSFEGSGIGLSLVRELVVLHGGSINASSTEGAGSIFTIRIPMGLSHLPEEKLIKPRPLEQGNASSRSYIAEAEQWIGMDELNPPSSEVPDTFLPGFTKKPTILLADDNADMRQYIYRLLSVRFNVTLARNGLQALLEAKKNPPDLILADVMMPELDGLGLLKELKAHSVTAVIPVILLSARAGEEARIEGLQAGADDYLVKPFSANELIARVSTMASANRIKRDTESRLYELFMQAPAAIALLRGPDHVFELANAFYLEVTGRTGGILGLPIRHALPELVSQGYLELLDHTYQTGIPYYGNEVLVHFDPTNGQRARSIYFDFVYQPIKSSVGVEGILVHAVDVTAKVIATRAAVERESNLHTKVKQQAIVSELGLLALRDNDPRKVMDDAVQRLRSVFQVEFTTVLELLPDGDVIIFRAGAGWKREVVMDETVIKTNANSQAGYTLTSEKPVIVTDLATETRFNGSEILTNHGVISGMSCVIWGKENVPYGVLGVHSTRHLAFTNDDVSFLQAVANILAAAVQRKQDEERLKYLATQKDEFMGIASHELKTPVTSIKASIQIINRLMADQSFDKAGIFLSKANTHIDKLTSLINDLLDVSKIQAGKLQYDFTEFTVGEMIEEAIEQVDHQSTQQIVVHGDHSTRMVGDKIRLEQVVTNLLTNAIKYSRGKGEVGIDVDQHDGHVRISVTDLGIGIPEELLPRVFDRFFRVEKTSQHFPGLGLGLYISYEIIRRHGGKIEVESTEGKGSKFTFEVPVRQDEGDPLMQTDKYGEEGVDIR